MHFLILILLFPEYFCTKENYDYYPAENHENSEITTAITEIRKYNTLSKNDEAKIMDVGPLVIDDSNINDLKFKFNIALNLKSLKKPMNGENEMNYTVIKENDTNTQNLNYDPFSENTINKGFRENNNIVTKNKDNDTNTEDGENDTNSEANLVSEKTYIAENNETITKIKQNYTNTENEKDNSEANLTTTTEGNE